MSKQTILTLVVGQVVDDSHYPSRPMQSTIVLIQTVVVKRGAVVMPHR